MFSSKPGQRVGRAVTFGELYGAREGEALQLNTAQGATCKRCGQEPRLYHHVSPKGRDVTLWIPVEHVCRGAGGGR